MVGPLRVEVVRSQFLHGAPATNISPASHIKPGAPRLDDVGLPNTHDAGHMQAARSASGAGVVGGFFFQLFL